MQKVDQDFKSKQKDIKNKISNLKMSRQLMKKKKIRNQIQRTF